MKIQSVQSNSLTQWVCCPSTAVISPTRTPTVIFITNVCHAGFVSPADCPRKTGWLSAAYSIRTDFQEVKETYGRQGDKAPCTTSNQLSGGIHTSPPNRRRLGSYGGI
ncbi:hypothetical protein PGTUg99_031173 [Puccinia graminis f. sp. tritici]|uniref:Uncharacterized protein n=1 Tax=Puccinia graminis f. sp. tritici TaxID=56615 RepID=A0A5B0RVY6_PUCGR|nr:hypothetical protein PGTUg99_031173 [Puccinia graminis f. sp. tritici]